MKKLIALLMIGWFSIINYTSSVTEAAIVQAMDYREELDLARQELTNNWIELKMEYRLFKATLSEQELTDLRELKNTLHSESRLLIDTFRAIEGKTIEDLENLNQGIRSLRLIFIDNAISVLSEEHGAVFQKWSQAWLAHFDARFELRVNFHEAKKAFRIETYSRKAQEIASKIEAKLNEIEQKADHQLIIPIYEKIFNVLQEKIAIFDAKGMTSATEPLVALLDLFAYKIDLLYSGDPDHIEDIANVILSDLAAVDSE